MAFRQVARPAAEKLQAEIQPLKQRFRRKQLDPGRRKLYRQRQPVEPAADLFHRGRVRVRKPEGGRGGPGPLAEELDGR